MGETMYVKANATQLLDEKNKKHALLWGDAVTDAVDEGDGAHVRGTGHAHPGLVPKEDLQTTPLELLELYVIDVGQGDAILLRTPDRSWHLIDGGPPKADSLLGEGARKFLAWKFGAELGLETVPLRTVFLSHSDEDHFGGLTEILLSDYPANPDTDENPLTTTVEHFLHAGVAKYHGEVELGVEGGRIPAEHLLSGRESFAEPPFRLAREFGKFASALGNVTTAAGQAPDIRRVTHKDTVPDYGPGTGRPFSMHLLGPVPENKAGDLRSFGKTSLTVNGHSVVVRLDYDKVRILLTGDINAKAQRHLLEGDVDGSEFTADVLKACHHGAEDIDSKFTKAVAARVCIVSSGDNEGHSHPRPSALGGYAYYGRRSSMTEAPTNNGVQPPLVYATEIARSITTKEVTVGGQPATAIDEVTFGLVNIRTDGRKIVCAVRDEQSNQFEVEELWVDADDEPSHDPLRED